MSRYSVRHYSELNQIPESLYLYLEQYPFSNYEILQSLVSLRENSRKYGELLECLIVEKKGIIQVTTLRVIPYNIMISHLSDLNAITALVKYMGSEDIQIPGVFGPSEVSAFFAKEWEKSNKESFQTSDESWFFLLDRLLQLPTNIGNIVIATKEHEDLLNRWSDAAVLELIPDSPRSFLESARKNLSIRLRDNKVFILMVNKNIVSMGAITGRYRDMQFINDIFTPPEHRCKGYATELCTRLVQRIKKDNNNRPVLTVFVSNEKAIRIYKKIGFKRITKVALFLK